MTAPVAQLDRVSASEAECHRFESCRARHFLKLQQILLLALFLSISMVICAETAHWQQPSYIKKSFIDIALNNEYSAQQDVVRKWVQPIRYFFEHHSADKVLHEQLTQLHLQHLADITGLSIEQTAVKNDANLIIIFTRESLLEQEIQQSFHIHDHKRQQFFSHKSVCLAHFSIYSDYRIHQAVVIIPVDRARAHAKLISCIVEELTQVMGLPNDSEKVFPSIFNDNSFNDLLTGLDYLLLKLLYNPNIKQGMTQEQISPILDNIIDSPQFQQEILSADLKVQESPLANLF